MIEESETIVDVDTIELVQMDGMSNKDEEGADDEIQKMSNRFWSFFGF